MATGKAIQNDDIKGLTEFYYCISDCVNALKKMCCFSDLGSTEILRQTIRRLPQSLRNKWAEYSMSFRSRGEYEPTLLDLEKWLQLRVLARTDAYLPAIERKGKQKSDAPPEDKRSLPTGRPKRDTPGKQPEKKAPPSKEPEKKQKSSVNIVEINIESILVRNTRQYLQRNVRNSSSRQISAIIVSVVIMQQISAPLNARALKIVADNGIIRLYMMST